jgi:hypothetical protein
MAFSFLRCKFLGAQSHSGKARRQGAPLELIWGDVEDILGHAKAPREQRDAILRHVASWGDRESPWPI